MSNALTISNTGTNDGWSDAAAEAAESVVRGTLLRFADWHWTAGQADKPLPEGTQLVAWETAAGWVKWADGKPVEYLMREPGQRLRDRDELGDTDAASWEAGPGGEPRDPWQNSRFVYLFDSNTLEVFTFSTSSFGGRGAVTYLGDQIQRMRSARPGAIPVVELTAAPMKTKFGNKSKPVFKVIRWIDAANRAPAEDEPKQVTAAPLAAELCDEIPF
jgi:hypothetical protein